MQSIPLMPEQASTYAWGVDALYLFLVGLTLIFSVGIALAIIIFAIKYRRRTPQDLPRPMEGAIKLEVVWTVIPFIISMGIFAWGASLYFTQRRIPAETMDVYVVGKQWMWKFQHVEGQREINELHVPVGRRIKLTMTTEDVIHSLFVPAFRMKMDVVPGKYTTAWFEATKPGRYHLFCAEYCGTNHSTMIGWVEVMEPQDFQAWLGGETSGSTLASSGEKLFQQLACATCHRPDSVGRGPVMNGLFGKEIQLDNGETIRADADYIRESILNPQAKIVAGYARPSIMPTFQGRISEEQLLQIVEYIKSVGPKEGSTSGGQPQGGTTPAASSAQRPGGGQ